MNFLASQANSMPPLTLIEVSPVNSALPACGRALSTYLRSIVPVTQLVLLITVPLEVLLALLSVLVRVLQPGRQWLALPLRIILYSVASAFLAPALIHIFHRSKSGRPSSIGAAIRFALPLWGRSFACRLQAVLYILLGTIAFVIPGVILILFALLVDPVVALEPAERKVFRRSRLLGKGLRIQFATALTIIVILQLAASFALLSALSHLISAQPLLAFAGVLQSGATIVQQILGVLAVALSFELYLAARATRPINTSTSRRSFASRVRSQLTPKFGSTEQAGFSLVETVVAVTVLFVAVVIGMQFLMVRAASITLSERQNQAEETVESGLNALATRADLVGSVPTFNLQTDGSIQITSPCQDISCDLVYPTNTPLSLRTSVAGGVPLSSRTGTPLFYRRWRFDEIDPQKHLYRITLVTLAEENATRPLAIRSVEAVLNFQ